MNFNKYYADNYHDARAKFLAVCAAKKLEVDKHVHPLSVDSVNELATDVIYLGPEEATKILVLTSGVHGAELMCGSGCQAGHLDTDSFAQLPAGVGVLIIHALNPWGAANLRRNNEDNIDLARNFIDFSQPLPTNDDYPELHQVVSEPCYETFHEKLKEYVEKHGKSKFVASLMGGQYSYPDGFSYGGTQPTWSNSLFCQLLQRYGVQAEKICHVDFHTAVGPYGYGMAVCMQTGATLNRARRWFGNWVVAPREQRDSGNQENYSVTGHPSDAVMRSFTGNEQEVVSIVLEFGTFETVEFNLPIMMDDHWLAQHGDIDSDPGRQIKAKVLQAHLPDDPEWRYAVWTRSCQVLRQAFAGLQE